MAIDAKLLEILACPACKTRVVEQGETLYCANPECRRAYTVADGIPVMLIDESTVLETEAWKKTLGEALTDE
jgi:uncharacterized protein